MVHGETAGQKDDADVIAQILVVHGTPDDFDLAVETFDELVHLGDFGHGDGIVVAEAELEEQMLGIGDLVVLQERRGLGCLDGLAESVFATGTAGGDECYTAATKGGGYIGKVEVDVATLVDDVGNGLGRRGQRVIGLAEGIAEVEVRIDVDEAVVVDDEQCVAPLLDGLDTIECHQNLLFALELEGDGDDADGEDAQFVGDLSHDGRGACACATTHTGSDEDHLGAIGQGLADGFGVLLGEVACNLRLCACT